MVKGLLEYLLATLLLSLMLFVIWYVCLCATGYSALGTCHAF